MKMKIFYRGFIVVFLLRAIVGNAQQTPLPAHAGTISNNATGNSALLNNPYSVYVQGNYAYVVSFTGHSFEVIDISNPAAPVHVAGLANGANGAKLTNPRSVFVLGNYAYVASEGSNALEIIDVSNPAAPIHAASIINGTNGALLQGVKSVYVSGNYAYVASTLSNALEVVNVANPLSPVHAGSIVNGAGGALLSSPYSVHVSGNYAYLASLGSNALEIVDVGNPSNPVHAGSLTHGSGGALLNEPLSVYVAGSYAYMTSFTSNALEIVNVSNPTSPVHAGSLSDGTGGALLSHAFSVFVAGNHAYIASGSSSALEIVNISNPATPVHAGSLTNGSGGALLAGPSSVRVVGNFAYITSSSSKALEVVNISDPTLPVHAGSLVNGPGALLTNPNSVFVSGSYAYVASAGSNAFEVIDISNPSAPIHAASLSDGTGGAKLSNPRSVFVSGNYAYVASAGSNALEIVNISNPLAPTHAGSIIHGAGGAQLQNCSSVYVSGNYAYVAVTDNSALEIVNVTDRAAPTHQGTLSGFTSTNSVFVSGNYAYLTTSNALKIVNISDPSTPVMAGSIADGTGGASLNLPYSVFVSGNYAFVASVFSNALEIINISTPSAPAHAGSLVNGTGGAKLNHPASVFVSGNYAYVVSNAGKSLEIVDVTTPSSPSHAASLLDGVGGASLGEPTSVFVSGGYAYVTNYGEVLEIVSLFQPSTPVAADAALVTQTSFTANWTIVSNASAYLLDVSTDNFSTFIDGYENTELSVISWPIMSLNRGTSYSYRVRAKNINGTTVSSNVISVTTIPDTPVTTAATSVTETSFTINWTAVPGASIYYVDVGWDGFTNIVEGYDNRSTATNSIAVMGLSGSIYYSYRVRAANGSGTSPSSTPASEATGPAEPSVAGPLTFTGFTTTTLTAEFPSAEGTTGHLILQRVGASPTGTPVDGSTYAVGNVIGDAVVVGVGTNIFTASGLTPNTVYYYDVIAYNGAGTLTNYNQANRSEGSRTTLHTAPTALPTSPVFSNGTLNELDISFTAAAGVDGYIVIVGRDVGSYGSESPIGGIQYSMDQLIPSEFGHSGYVRYVGNGTSFTAISLTPGLQYCYSFYSFNGAGEAVNYSGPTMACAYSLAQEPEAPTGLTFSNASVSSISASFSQGNANGFLVLQKEGSSPTATPTDGVVYSINDVLGDATVVSDVFNSFTSNSLNANTVYYYDIISYGGFQGGINYNTSDPLEASHSTLQVEPGNQPTDIIFSNVTSSTLDCSFTAAAGSPTGYLVLRKLDSAPTGVPVDGTIYSAGSSIGDGTIVYTGSSPAFSDPSTQSGRTYHYSVFAYNGSGATINYLTANPTVASIITAPSVPSIKSAGDQEQTSFTAIWNGATGADNYLLDVSTDNFVTLLSGYDAKPVNGTSASVTGLVGGTVYQHRVRAANTSGVSENSSTQTALTKPPTPVGFVATAIGLSSFTANWSAATSATSYFLDVATDEGFTSLLIGYNDLAVAGTSQSITGLISNTVYYYRVRAYNNSGYTPSSDVIATSTLTTEPVAQPTALLLTDPTTSSIGLSFTEALGNPTGYIILMKSGSSPTDIPIDGVTYAVGSALGSSQVVFYGSFNSLGVLNLSVNTRYYFTVFAFNGSATSTNYLITNPLSGNRFTLVPEPTSQPTFLGFDNVTINSMDMGFIAAPGADGYIVFRYHGPSGGVHSGGPSDGTVYTQGSVANDGAVVSVWTGTLFSQTGLSANTLYDYTIYSFAGSGQTINYLTAAPLTGSRSTLMSEPASPPTGLTFSGLTPTSLDGSFTASSAEGFLILQTEGSSSTGVPVDGTVYAVNDLVGNGKVVGVGTATTFTATALSANSIYYYDVIAYNGSGNTTNYNSSARLESSHTTLQVEPSAQAAGILFSNVTTSALDGSFVAASGSPSGYVILGRAGSAPTGIPVDGVAYNAGDVIADSKVVSVSGSSAFVDAGLAAGTVYHYAIFSFNGIGEAINYLETNPAAASVITISPAPAATTANNITSSSFTANWNSATGATAYELDVSLDNFSTFVNGYDAKLVSSTSDEVSGMNAGTTYKYRVRAVNGSGVSANSNTVSQITVPQVPNATTATAVGLNSFTANWTGVASATGYFLDVATDDTFNSIQVGYDNLSVTGTSRNVTGLNSSTAYYYRVRAVNGAGTTPSSSFITVSTLTTEPVAQPTAMSFSNPSTSGIRVSFTVALGNPSGYIVLMKQDASPTDIPVDGETYTVGSFLGTSQVVSSGSASSFDVAGLSANTEYYFAVFSFNGVLSSWNYLITNPLAGSRFTLEPEPTSQPTAISFDNVTVGSMDVAFIPSSGSNGFIVLRRQGSAPTEVPADGVIYSPGSVIGVSDIVFVGAGTSFSQSGLGANTTYHYAIYSYAGSGQATNYLTTAHLQGSRSTLKSEPTASPTGLIFTAFTTSSLDGLFTATSADGYLVLQTLGSSSTGVPADGSVYAVDDVVGNGKVVSVGAATSFTASGLSANSVYFYDVIAYNGSGNTINYNTSSRLEGNRSTLEAEPTAQASAILFNNVTTSSLESSFTAAAGSPSGYLVLSRPGSAPTGIPADGAVMAEGAFIGDSEVVSVSGTTDFSHAGLVAGTVYHYAIFSFNGTDEAINYLTASPASISVITISAAPVATTPTNVTSDSFTVKWTAVTGATGYMLDVSLDNFSNLISDYAAKPVNGTSDIVSGLDAGTTYQYRVRAVNVSGVSDDSNTISQITVPAIPTALAAASVRTNDFTAVWTDVQGETRYELEVSANNFASPLTGYSPKVLDSDATEETVTGLSPSTPYQYRIRAVNDGGATVYSNKIEVTTNAGPVTNPLAIGGIVFPPTYEGTGSINIVATIAGNALGKEATIHHRGTATDSFTANPMDNPSGNTFQYTVLPEELDEIGLEFYITATNGSEHDESESKFIYRSFATSQSPRISSILSFGGRVDTYQIISIPFKLDDDLISSIFEPALGEYDKTKWRLVRYQGGKNTDYHGGLTRINLGESYWFNSLSEVEIKVPGSGSAAPYNQSKPFVLKLLQGWNQIATPFPFSIDWDDILAINGDPAGVGPYREFDQSIINFKSSNSLLPFSGGFVHTDNAIDLNIPVALKNTAGGRIASTTIGTDIGQDNWILPITLQQGRVTNPLGGIGMHSLAKASKDDFDDITLPRFVNHLEFNSYHSEFFEPRFSRDVVPTGNQYSWEITIESDFEEGPITLNWSDSDLGNNEAQLLLLDPVSDVLVDMKKIRTYTLGSASGQSLKLIYFRESRIDIGDMVYLNKPYPNPSSMKVDFDLFSDTDADFQLEIFDLFGKRVHSMDHVMHGVLTKTIEWPGYDRAGQKVPNGLYVYKLTSHSDRGSKVSQGRIIIH
jgi:hypothetical protein